MAKKMSLARRRMRTRSRPLTLDALAAYGAFKGLERPAGEFDPNGRWEQVYQIWLVQPWRNDSGHVRVARSIGADGLVGLDVEQRVIQSSGTVHLTKASLKCKPDRLAQPVSWRVESVLLGLDSKPMAETRVRESAEVKGARIAVTAGKRTRSFEAPAPLTTSWSLVDAAQRLPGQTTRPVSFTLLEETDLVKPGHVLSFREKKAFEMNGASEPLTVYDHIGAGILPERLFVDGAGRLRFAISGIRAFMLDPQAEQRTAKRLEWYAKRRRQRR